jgi:hypothetical protein
MLDIFNIHKVCFPMNGFEQQMKQTFKEDNVTPKLLKWGVTTKKLLNP